MLAVTTSLVVVLEVLSHISSKNHSQGAVAFAAESDSFTTGTEFGYHLALAIFVGVCEADHDTKISLSSDNSSSVL